MKITKQIYIEERKRIWTVWNLNMQIWLYIYIIQFRFISIRFVTSKRRKKSFFFRQNVKTIQKKLILYLCFFSQT